jgi:nitrogen fixation-related uncharacterized protein
MEATMLFLVLVIGLAALGGASLTWGVDTRETSQDDHAR